MPRWRRMLGGMLGRVVSLVLVIVAMALWMWLRPDHRERYEEAAADVSAAAADLPAPVGLVKPWTPRSGPGEREGVILTDEHMRAAIGQLSSGCVATVLLSPTRSLAITAARCVFVPASAPWRGEGAVGWRAGLTFQPGRTGVTAPFGSWSVERAWVDERWMSDADQRYDYAFLELGTKGDKRVGDLVSGASMLVLQDGDRPDVTVAGYPMSGTRDGRQLVGCSTAEVDRVPEDPALGLLGVGQMALACRMPRGAVGGPWIAGTGAPNTMGGVVGVTSNTDTTSSFLTGSALGESSLRLRHRAEDAIGLPPPRLSSRR